MKKIKKWKVLTEEDVSPSPWFPLYKHTVKLPNGAVIDDYYLSKLGDVVMVVPFTKDGKVIFVKQYKHGAGEVIIELPAGRIRKGNSPLKEAELELKEETGGTAKRFIKLGKLIFEPSKDTLRVHGFLALGVELTGEQELELTEDIEILLIPATEIDDRIKSGEIMASDTLAFIKLAQLKAPHLFR